jgi:protein-L-isoaspartate(D-aspartate) O-methyltransferase
MRVFFAVCTVALLTAVLCHAQSPLLDPAHSARLRMVETQLRARGIVNDAVLRAMTRVPRHMFVPEDLKPFAYDDRPLPIGRGQTISQPYIVAYMTEALDVRPTDIVLEVGTGSAYQAAVLAELARHVYTVEIIPDLATQARRSLADMGYHNVDVRAGNGYFGWPEHAPYSRILVTAAPAQIPQTLIDQLAVGGMMVLPVGTDAQEIVIVTKGASGVTQKKMIPVRFVPMVSKP